jgi:co-chaperonin GroES (HSP10)
LVTGDGKMPDGKDKPIWVSTGNVVMFQLIGNQDAVSQFLYNGNKVRILHQNDLIARLKSTKVSLENFEILGDWVLLRVDTSINTTLVVVPDAARRLEDFSFKVEQKGAGVEHDIQRDEEVFPERMRCNAVEIERVAYAFCTKGDIHGVVKAS